jgi:hypothetical protein
MAVDNELLQRMYVKIANGTAKADFPWKLDAEASEVWDRIEREVASLRAQGVGLEMTEIEVPDIPAWTAEAPEAQTSST